MPQNQEFVDIYSNSPESQKGNGKKKKSRWKKILIGVISVILVLAGGLFCVAWYFLGDMNIDTDFPKTDSELGLVSKDGQDVPLPILHYMELIPVPMHDQGHADATMMPFYR